MSNLKFDYETKHISESIGMSEKEHDNLGERIIEKAQEVAKNKTKPGYVAEWVVNNLSFAEMVYMTTREIFNEIDSATKHMDSSIKRGMPKELRKLLKGLDKMSDGKMVSPDGRITHAIRIDSADKMKELLERLKKLNGKRVDDSDDDDKKHISQEAPSFEELLKSLTQPKPSEDDPIEDKDDSLGEDKTEDK